MNFKIKLKYNQIIKLMYGVMIIIITISLYLLSTFLYQNFYKTMTESEAITMLKHELNIEIIDVASFKKVINHLSEKQKVPSFNIADIYDIFSPSRRIINDTQNPKINIETLKEE